MRKMGVASCQESMGILSTLLFLLAVTGSTGLTRPEGSPDIPAVTKRLQDPLQIVTDMRQEQDPSNLPTTSVQQLHYPLWPPEAPARGREPWVFEIQHKGATIDLITFQLPRPSTQRHTEMLTNLKTQQISWSYGHTNFARHKRESFTSKAVSKAPVTKDHQTIRNVATVYPAPSSSMNVSAPPDDPTSEMSTFDKMLLCDHPLETFSPSFLGSSWEACLQYDRKWVASFRNTLLLCDTVYSMTESNPESFTIGSYNSDVGPLKLITRESYVKICLPLFRRFNRCEERDFLTVCWEDRVAFLHSHNCHHSSNDIFLSFFLLVNNTECFHEFCEGWQNVVDAEVGGLLYRLTNNRYSPDAPLCGKFTMSLSHIYQQFNGTFYLIINDRWPCCYPLYLVIWADLPEAHGLNGAWSYLPAACQAGEVLLLVLVGCVMAGSVGGNLLVLVVMLSGGHRGQESSLLRTSLAFADLLRGTFVAVPSFIQHLVPFFSPPHYFALTPDMQLVYRPINVTSSIHLTNALYGWSGFPLFQSILFNTTSIVSMLMLMVLSLERFVITGRFLRYKDYFNYCRTVLAIVVAWTTSLATALWFASYSDGRLGAEWLTFEKLPTGASGHGPGGLRNVIYHGQFPIFIMLGISVVTFSALAIRNFVREQLHVAAEWRSLKMKASRQFSQDNRHVLTTMTLMLILFLTSTLPLTINIALNSVNYIFHQHTLFSYLSWWLFMAGSAWNPWVYNLRSRQFREEVTNFCGQVLRVRKWQQPHAEPKSSSSTVHPPESSWLPTRPK